MPSVFDPTAFLAKIGSGKTTRVYRNKQVVFSQGDAADAVFFIESVQGQAHGRLHARKASRHRRPGARQLLWRGLPGGTISARVHGERDSSVEHRAGRQEQHDPLAASRARIRGVFTAYLLSRNVRIEEDLVDQLFNSSEKRLARVLLLLAHFGKEPRPETVIPQISQETLAAMVGTTRSRVSHFMNRFRKLGFIHYNGGLQVHSGLLTVVLRD
jgi:hypothetical protein